VALFSSLAAPKEKMNPVSISRFCGAVASSALLIFVFIGAWLSCLRIAQAQSSLDVVYIESNIGSIANANSIFGFSNDGHGALTSLPGSPYLTGGTGFFDPTEKTTSLHADNQILLRMESDLLFAVNAHSNTISVLAVNSDGSLTPLAGSPVASGGQEPLSLALSDGILTGDVDLLTVANKDNDPGQSGGVPNFTTLMVTPSGTVTPVSESTMNLPGKGFPSEIFTTAHHGKYLFVSQLTGISTLYAYHYIPPSGVPVFVNSLAAGASQFCGEIANPTQRYIYASLPSGNSPQLAVYSYAQFGGNLAFVNSVANAARGTCWLNTDAKGTRLYTSNFNSGSVSVYDITQATAPLLLQTFTLSGATAHPTNLRMNPSGKFLYVLDGVNLHVLNVSGTDGTLTETAAPTVLPVPAGEFPIGLATTLK
jgi:6-phosphogluconolactonase (cycloisomerase 2 family)